MLDFVRPRLETVLTNPEGLSGLTWTWTWLENGVPLLVRLSEGNSGTGQVLA